jgi:hypothetical protein
LVKQLFDEYLAAPPGSDTDGGIAGQRSTRGGGASNLFQPPMNCYPASNGGRNLYSEVQTPTMTPTPTIGVWNRLAPGPMTGARRADHRLHRRSAIRPRPGACLRDTLRT